MNRLLIRGLLIVVFGFLALKMLVMLLSQLLPLLIVLVVLVAIIAGAFGYGSEPKCKDPKHRH